MSKALPRIPNQTVRRIFLARHGLSAPPRKAQSQADLLAVIDRLGFVQIDSIRTVERAHHMILFTRNQTYRQGDLVALIERDRALFENWTHDASVIPSRFFPYWQRRFAREAAALKKRWHAWGREGFEAETGAILEGIASKGPVMARDLGAKAEDGAARKGDGWWDWHPSKTALEYLWRTGALAVTRREGFQKVYDLTERVIPAEHLGREVNDAELVDWACREALLRLGFATSGELAAFWDIVTPAETRAWCAANLGRGCEAVEVEAADGTFRPCYAAPGLLDAPLPDSPARLRILSPFDPMIRDRRRAQRLFGFDYRIEVFVPAAKRRYGYYVFPLLEGDRLVGRIDMRCRRDECVLDICGLWWEPRVRESKGRMARLEAELDRIARFSGVDGVEFHLPE